MLYQNGGAGVVPSPQPYPARSPAGNVTVRTTGADFDRSKFQKGAYQPLRETDVTE